MDDSAHTQVYRRFFAVLLSVLPGLNLVLGVASGVIFLLNDILDLEWGWSIGAGAVALGLTFVVWVLVGLGIQKWAENKSAGMLFGLNAPFILVDGVIAGWLFFETVINASEPGSPDAAEAALVVVQALSSLV